ncbi:MAG: hypothetical protein K0R67_3758 [Paenibacillus sp.]|jgi:hypothetical protein|nr:hypothetical protein [Paenibacillus sp.]
MDDKEFRNNNDNRDDPDLDPFEINFLPEFEQGRGPRDVFVNEHGVVIGDHMYESEHSPLQQWTSDTDPDIMAGEEWVHPFKDIGFQSEENREYFEQGIVPSAQGTTFLHADKDVAYQDSTARGIGPNSTEEQ